MTDVQVSNARRVSFTALALVAFWIVAWRAYSIAFGFGFWSEFLMEVASFVEEHEWSGFLLDHGGVVAGLMLAGRSLTSSLFPAGVAAALTAWWYYRSKRKSNLS